MEDFGGSPKIDASEGLGRVPVLLENGTDDLEKILYGILAELDIPEDASESDFKEIFSMIKAELVGGNSELSGDVNLEIKEWLRRLGKAIGNVANRVVKRVTGKSIKEWRHSVGLKTRQEKTDEFFEKQNQELLAKIGAEGPSYLKMRAQELLKNEQREGLWREEQHPRDQSGRFITK